MVQLFLPMDQLFMPQKLFRVWAINEKLKIHPCACWYLHSLGERLADVCCVATTQCYVEHQKHSVCLFHGLQGLPAYERTHPSAQD